MRRLTATSLLLFALAGNLVPLALAAMADPPHACCLRKAAHPCHGSATTESESLIVRTGACCHQDCGWATATRRAQNHARVATVAAPVIAARVLSPCTDRPGSHVFQPRSSRAPPPTRLLWRNRSLDAWSTAHYGQLASAVRKATFTLPCGMEWGRGCGLNRLFQEAES